MLSNAGISSPRLEARLLIAHILHINANDVSLKTIIPENLIPSLETILQKRLQGMPLDKIFGHKEFYKYANKLALKWRYCKKQQMHPETECLHMIHIWQS